MRRGLLLAMLLAWLLGAGSTLLGVTLAGGWYEHLVIDADDLSHFVNREGWEVVQIIPPSRGREWFGDSVYLRRPRFRLP